MNLPPPLRKNPVGIAVAKESKASHNNKKTGRISGNPARITIPIEAEKKIHFKK